MTGEIGAMELNSIIFYITVILLCSILAYICEKCIDLSSTFIGRKHYCILLKCVGLTFYCASFLIAWFVSAVRYGIGTDYNLYRNIYEFLDVNDSILNSMKIFDVEPGWIIFNILVKKIYYDAQHVFIISSLIYIVCVYIVIYYYRRRINIGLSIFIFMCIAYVPSFNTVRQYVAIGIIMLSYRYIENKRLFTTLLIIALATCFHYTSLFWLPVYFYITSSSKAYKKKKIILFGVLIFILFNYNTMLSLIVSVSPSFAKYSRYTSDKIAGVNLAKILFQIPIVFIIIYYRKLFKNLGDFMYKFMDLYYVSVFLSFLSNMTSYAVRIAYYFEITQVIFIPYIIKSINNKFDKFIIVSFLIIYYLCYWYVYFAYLGHNEVIPYVTYWLWSP